MNKTKFCAVIERISWEELLKLLRNIFTRDKMNERIRLFGEEITYKDENIEIYVHTATSQSVQKSSAYLLEGTFFGPLDQEKVYFSKWFDILSSNSTPYSFEFFEEDSEGNMIFDSEEVRHPDYGKS